jgi:hypothetical protein
VILGGEQGLAFTLQLDDFSQPSFLLAYFTV